MAGIIGDISSTSITGPQTAGSYMFNQAKPASIGVSAESVERIMPWAIVAVVAIGLVVVLKGK